MKLVRMIGSIFMITMLLTACESTVEKLRRVGKAPNLTKLEVPIDEERLSPNEKKEQARDRTRRTNSLWQPGSTRFFSDNRAWKVGDILKIVVNITDSATLANSTAQTRNNTETSTINEVWGKKKAIAKTLGMAATASDFVDIAGRRNVNGSGNITRQESVQTVVAVLVRQVLPNGNLIIEGHQEVRVNHELREVRVAGIVRPKDVAADNSISSDQIAEARISYGGRGVVSDMQTPRAGSEVLDIISPF